MTAEYSATPKKLLAKQREALVLELKLAGFSYRKIGAQVGISEAQACRIVQKVMKRTEKAADESADTLRAIRREQLESLLAGFYTSAKKGHVGAGRLVLAYLAELNKLDGLYVEHRDTWNLDVDVASLTLDQVRQLAAGAHPAQVLAQALSQSPGDD